VLCLFVYISFYVTHSLCLTVCVCVYIVLYIVHRFVFFWYVMCVLYRDYLANYVFIYILFSYFMYA